MKTKFSVILPHFERPKLLHKTLLAYNQIKRDDFEVIVVDDFSQAWRLPEIPESLDFPIKLIRLLGEKDGTNPSLPLQIGAWHAEGEFYVLSSPEVTPLHDFFQKVDQPSGLSCGKYFLLNVFAITGELFNSIPGRAIQTILQDLDSTQSKELRLQLEVRLGEGLGLKGFAWANEYGSWYQHPIHKPSDLHFLSVICAKDFWKLGGFDTRFRSGGGFEDLEFRDRCRATLRLIRLDELSAIHFDHEEVTSRKDLRISLNSNELLYRSTKALRRKSINPINLGKHDFVINYIS
jgi:hypothetical protein